MGPAPTRWLPCRGRVRWEKGDTSGWFSSELALDFQYIDAQLPPESPYLYGLHPNAEIGFLTQTSEKLFRTVLELQPRDSQAGEGAGATREEKVRGRLAQDIPGAQYCPGRHFRRGPWWDAQCRRQGAHLPLPRLVQRSSSRPRPAVGWPGGPSGYLIGGTHFPCVGVLLIHPKKCASGAHLSATPWVVARQAPLSRGFSRQEYWSGLPFPSPGAVPSPGIKPGSPALQADSVPTGLLTPRQVLFLFVNPSEEKAGLNSCALGTLKRTSKGSLAN